MRDDETYGEFLKRAVALSLLGLVVAAGAIYLGDWAVWRVRVARGGGMGTFQRSRVVIAPLKGGKEEYYAAEMEEVECSRSLFRQAGVGACWQVEKEQMVLDRR